MPTIPPYHSPQLPDDFTLWLEQLRDTLAGLPKYTKGAGSPEGVVKGTYGDRYFNRTGSAGSFEYLKTTESGNTGWIAVA